MSEHNTKMQITVTRVQHIQETGLVDKKSLVSQMYNEWLASKKVPDGNGGFDSATHITDDGRFEYWYDTGHGSGISSYLEMTEEDKKVAEAFKTIMWLYA